MNDILAIVVVGELIAKYANVDCEYGDTVSVISSEKKHCLRPPDPMETSCQIGAPVVRSTFADTFASCV